MSGFKDFGWWIFKPIQIKHRKTVLHFLLTKLVLLICLGGCCLFFLMAPAVSQELADETRAETSEKLYRQAYRFAVANDFVQAIRLMSQIQPSAIHYKAAQKKVTEWKKILIARGTTYEKEMARQEYEQAYFWAKKGHFVRAIYEMKKILPSSPVYTQAQQKIELWTRIAESSGSRLTVALENYLKPLREAEQLAATGDLEKAIQIAKRIDEDSPYYPMVKNSLEQWTAQLEKKVVAETSDIVNDTQPQSIPSTDLTQDQSATTTLPTWDLSLQNRYGFPFGQELTPGLGIGLAWYGMSNLGLHVEGNAFISENFISWFVPFTLRFAPLRGDNWRLYMGFGGFGVLVEEKVPLGAMLELGADWWLTPHFGLGAGLDYGLSLSPKISHTLGLNLQAKLGF